jgi:hypothetical protein
MPAIDLARLKIQSAKVVDQFADPTTLVRGLHELFEFYSDRTLRPGQVVSPVLVLPSYRVSAPVIRHLESELGLQAEGRPEETLALADALWSDGYFETRMLAAYLLGRIKPRGDDFMDRFTDWVAETREPNVRKALLNTGLNRMRREYPDRFLRMMNRWVNPTRQKMWSNAIRALIPLLEDNSFENLPPVYDTVRPIIETAPSIMQNEIAELIKALYASSPTETTYYLQQVLVASPNPQTAITLRRILASLPPAVQDGLRETLRAKK